MPADPTQPASECLRQATPDDLDDLMALDILCFEGGWSARGWLDELDAGAVMVAGQPLVGMACAKIVVDICELRRIGVDPSARRAGLGRDLLAHVIEHASTQGCVGVQLEVSADNEPALGLYQAHGFEVVARRRGYYSSPPGDALLMNLRLRERPSQNND